MFFFSFILSPLFPLYSLPFFSVFIFLSCSSSLVPSFFSPRTPLFLLLRLFVFLLIVIYLLTFFLSLLKWLFFFLLFLLSIIIFLFFFLLSVLTDSLSYFPSFILPSHISYFSSFLFFSSCHLSFSYFHSFIGRQTLIIVKYVREKRKIFLRVFRFLEDLVASGVCPSARLSCSLVSRRYRIPSSALSSFLFFLPSLIPTSLNSFHL